jgi:phytanoyl-CoA hydroxylase
VLRDFFDADTAAALRARALQLADGVDLTGHPRTVFVTRDDNKHVSDTYFLNSGDCVRFFFEEDAFDASGQLRVPKAQAINKIGHGALSVHPPPHTRNRLRETHPHARAPG